MTRQNLGDPDNGGFRPHTSESLVEHHIRSKPADPDRRQIERERIREANIEAGRNEKARFVCEAKGCEIYSGGQRWWILEEKAEAHASRYGHVVVRI